MLRTFDQSGYYETRLILMAFSLAIAGYFAYYKRDQRFITMFACGAVLQMVSEYLLQFGGMRGAGYTIAVFGMKLPGLVQPIFKGLTEGGSLGIFAFWFADLRSSRAKLKSAIPFLGLCAVVFALAIVSGSISGHGQITSARQMFSPLSIFAVMAIIFASLWLAWRKDVMASLSNFYGGLLLFTILNYGVLQVMGARYIGEQVGGQFVAAPTSVRGAMMVLSMVFETAGGKLHFFMIPFALGLIALKEKEEATSKRERYSTQHLQDLSQRGWRKRSKPFPK
ncbi:MAG: hypothetical protein SF339_29905 [Blastocatellia bacterium]|nr:hypothetical protein [Blastocatellia bacterium]